MKISWFFVKTYKYYVTAPYCQVTKFEKEENLGIKFQGFRRFRRFRVFDLPLFRFF